MKLSAAILVSVNLVAAMPAACQAADGTVSDKAEWLKSNLAAMESAPKQEPVRPELRKVSLSDAGLARQPVKGAPRVKAFVANRRLPSRRELYASMPTLTAQQPTMGQLQDPSGAPLSGQVSAYA